MLVGLCAVAAHLSAHEKNMKASCFQIKLLLLPFIMHQLVSCVGASGDLFFTC